MNKIVPIEKRLNNFYIDYKINDIPTEFFPLLRRGNIVAPNPEIEGLIRQSMVRGNVTKGEFDDWFVEKEIRPGIKFSCHIDVLLGKALIDSIAFTDSNGNQLDRTCLDMPIEELSSYNMPEIIHTASVAGQVAHKEQRKLNPESRKKKFTHRKRRTKEELIAAGIIPKQIENKNSKRRSIEEMIIYRMENGIPQPTYKKKSANDLVKKLTRQINLP